MDKININNLMRFITMYSCVKSEELDEFFNRDEDEFVLSGDTATLYENMSIPNLIVRLMDNRDFNKMPDDVKREMIYNDYYPIESQTDERVYFDNRWNMCQELHNKMCKSIGVTPTAVRFKNFNEMGFDSGEFYNYDPIKGIIYLNSMIDYSSCDNTELVERVLQATFTHEIYSRIKRHLCSLDEVSPEQKYILLSTFARLFAFSSMTKEKLFDNIRSMENADGGSVLRVYSIYSSYEFLNKFFDKYKLYDQPAMDLDIFKDSRLNYLEQLAGTEEGEDEEMDEFYVDEDIDEEDPEVVDGLLYDTIGYDLDILSSIEDSVLNDDSRGVVFNTLLSEMDKCAGDFYSFFGNGLQISFKHQYYDYRTEMARQNEEDDEDCFE